MENKEIEKMIMDLPDEVLSHIQFSVPWQTDAGDYPNGKDEDGFLVNGAGVKNANTNASREMIQQECWSKFHKNPQVNTAVRGLVGRMTGMGFETTSEIDEIQDVIEEVELDPRNRLYNFWPKYIGRYNVEGELFLSLTCHPTGFVEVDFIDPSAIDSIIFHPSKTIMPLFYTVKVESNSSNLINDTQQIPSVFIARYPELIEVARKDSLFSSQYQASCKSKKNKFNEIGGFFRFIVAWDKGFVTKRAVSYVRTTLEWLNHYENLKKYEIDHKKSSGAYLWILTCERPQDFKAWLCLTEEERRKTGIMSKKTPGGTLLLPPGFDIKCINPNLAKITDQDNDILNMIGSGLNESEDVMMGSNKGTFASTKASRGPMSDRTADEIAYFDRFLKNDFWGSIFFLKNKVAGFPAFFKQEECVGYHKETIEVEEPIPLVGGKGKQFIDIADLYEVFNSFAETKAKPAKSAGAAKPAAPAVIPHPMKKVKKEVMVPDFKNKKRRPEQLIDISYPVSETIDFEARARGLLGVKHGPVSDTLGVPNSGVAARLGISGYGRMRLRKSTEDNKYPPLLYTMDAESAQEKIEAEPPKPKK